MTYKEKELAWRLKLAGEFLKMKTKSLRWIKRTLNLSMMDLRRSGLVMAMPVNGEMMLIVPAWMETEKEKE
jgi:hypothetical protein